MQKSKLFSLLRKLETSEWDKFEEFLSSPYFNKRKELITFFKYIKRFSPKLDQSLLSKAQLVKRFFPEVKNGNDRLYALASALLDLLCTFFTLEKNRKERLAAQLDLIGLLQEKGEIKQMDTAIRKFKTLSTKDKVKSDLEHWYSFQLATHLDNHFLTNPKRTFDQNLQDKSDSLDRFYLIKKFEIACDMVSRNKVIQADYECHFLDDLLKKTDLTTIAHLQLDSLKVYRAILNMLKSGDEDDYRRAKNILFELQHEFTQKELFTLHDYLLNYCIQKINAGKHDYYNEILDIYRFMLEKKIIIHENKLTEWDYKNIVTVGIRLEDFAWVEQFIKDYKSYLSKDVRENAYLYNLAALHYARKEYGLALQTLHEVEFTDTTYHLGAKIIQMKSYFELEEDEAFYALLEAFRMYLKRSKQISEYRKDANLNMLKLAKRLYQIKEIQFVSSKKVVEEKKLQLENEIQSLTPVANKDWLNHSLSEL